MVGKPFPELDAQGAAPVILALDTSSKATGLALARGAEILTAEMIEGDDQRSQRLWLDVARLLERAGLTAGKIDAFAACVGPGGFTGLRVGLAAIKGLAAATGKPAVGVTSLEAAAFAARPAETVAVLTGAYKGEMYWQFFTFDEEGCPVPANEPGVGEIDTVLDRAASFADLTWAGEAVRPHADRIRERGAGRKWQVGATQGNLAEAIAGLAYLRLRRGEGGTAESLGAVYVRPAAAEVKLAQGLVGSKLNSLLRS